MLGFESRSPHELSTGNGGRWDGGWVGPCMLIVDGRWASGGGHVEQNVMNINTNKNDPEMIKIQIQKRINTHNTKTNDRSRHEREVPR